MYLQTRKIAFIQDFLELQSELAISRLEELLRKEKEKVSDMAKEPMTEIELGSQPVFFRNLKGGRRTGKYGTKMAIPLL